MFCRLKWLQLGAMALLVTFVVSSVMTAPTSAQDAATETPTTGEPKAAATGVLTIMTLICIRDDQPEGTISLGMRGGTSGLECTPGDAASLSIDGEPATEFPTGTQVPLPTGSHTITETTQGATLTVDIADGAETIVEVSTAAAPIAPTATVPPTETPVPEATMPALGSVRIVTHACREGVDLTTLETGLDWTQQVLNCPALTLPGNYGDVPPDYTTANDPDNPLPYDISFAYQADGAPTTVQIADAAFQNGQICEEDFGANLNGVGTDNHCWDLSGYQVEDVRPGAVTITTTELPAGYTFGIARTDPASDDADALTGSDRDAGSIQLDTSADGAVVVHLFVVPVPAENRVTIVSHLCPAGIESRADFNALADHWARLNTCPSIVRIDDEAAPDAVTAGPVDFGIEVEGADLVKQQLADVPFDQQKACEADLPTSINADPNDNVCLDLSRYEFENVAQGAITVRAGKQLPPGAVFVGVSFVPGSNDESTLVSAPPAGGTIKLNTTTDGYVTLHVFYGPRPVVATATPTKTPTAVQPTRTPTRVATKTATPTGPTSTPSASSTPGGPTATPSATNTPLASTGSLQIFKFWCEGDESLTRINALAPGQDATRSDLGDATCANGNSDFIIFDANGNQLRTVTVEPIGVLLVDNLAASEVAGRYTIQDTRSSATATFAIESGTITKVISLHYQFVEEIPDAPDIPQFDLEDDPPPDDYLDDGYIDVEDEFPFDGPVAVPDGSNPFTVVDDPEAKARVEAIDTFEEMPGVGIGPAPSNHTAIMPWLIVLVGPMVPLIGARLRFTRLWRRRT